MAINKSFKRVSQDTKTGPKGQTLEEFTGAVHRVAKIEELSLKRALLTIRVYPSAELIDVLQVDENGYPDYTKPTLKSYPEQIGEYELLVKGKTALQLLGQDDEPFTAPTGTPTAERWSWRAQAYRYLHTLSDFSEAVKV